MMNALHPSCLSFVFYRRRRVLLLLLLLLGFHGFLSVPFVQGRHANTRFPTHENTLHGKRYYSFTYDSSLDLVSHPSRLQVRQLPFIRTRREPTRLVSFRPLDSTRWLGLGLGLGLSKDVPKNKSPKSDMDTMTRLTFLRMTLRGGTLITEEDTQTEREQENGEEESSTTRSNNNTDNLSMTDRTIDSKEIRLEENHRVLLDHDNRTNREQEEEEEEENNQLIQSLNQEDESSIWRCHLPPDLQKRKNSLHRLLVHTGHSIFKDTPSTIQDPTIAQQDHTDPQTQPCYCEVYILGTAHVSNVSCIDAKLLMEHVHPDCLFLELCHQRVGLLESAGIDDDIEHSSSSSSEHKRNPGSNNITTNRTTTHPHLMLDSSSTSSPPTTSVSQTAKLLMAKNPSMSRVAAMSSALLTKIQADYATKLGVQIGGEFLAAFQMASRQQGRFEKQQRMQQRLYQLMPWQQQLGPPQNGYGVLTPSMDAFLDTKEILPSHGCATVLGDRPMRLTLLRAWESLTWYGKIKMMLGLLWSLFRQPSEKELKEWMDSIMNDPTSDVLTKSMEELGRIFPTLETTIVKERDEYMAAKIMQIATLLGEATCVDGRRRTIVAVVGVGHCKGMISLLQQFSKEREIGSRDPVEESKNTYVRLESILARLVETKKHKIDKDEELKALTTDITVVDSQQFSH